MVLPGSRRRGLTGTISIELVGVVCVRARCTAAALLLPISIHTHALGHGPSYPVLGCM